ncbi:oxidoreductase [Massilia sp. Root351]|jgi:scyllo-inositol 2-dehydrogenase (NADP+)|uniref:oxidoreductase n=1 Tax=Massilia sp. Root351 TaxID=1736522 RepID=UPI00070DE96F|nr:oxidoreductase [Massilia sp. Root351]KQV82550.1 oxidoreductase [Massilia sp. Root351]
MQACSVGLIGYGLAGKVFHAPLIAAAASSGLRLARISSSSADADEVRRSYPGVVLDAGPQAMLADPHIGLIVVATPNASHYALARAALEAGKHVVIDKPFVVSSEQGEALVALANGKGLLLSAFHNRRWDNDFLTLRNCIESGRLGQVHSYFAHFDRYAPQVKTRWKEEQQPGAGILWDLGSHLIDQALQLFGMPRAVTADLSVQRAGALVEDYFHLTMDYGHCKAVLRAGMQVCAPGPRYEVHGTQGSFSKYGIDGQETALKHGARPGDKGWGGDEGAHYATVTVMAAGVPVAERLPTLAGSYESYYAGMGRAINAGLPVPVAAADALNVVRVIEAAQASHRERRTVDFPL